MKSINKFEFIAILFFLVTIVGCNKSDESKKIDLNTENQGYVFQMNGKYLGQENHDLSKIQISSIEIKYDR